MSGKINLTDPAMTHMLQFLSDEPVHPFNKQSKSCLNTIFERNWEKLKAASGTIVKGLMADVAKKYAEHAPDGYKLFNDLHQKLKAFKAHNPPEYMSINRAFKGSLSHQRFIQLGEMIETADELRRIWDRIEPYIGVKIPTSNQRNFQICLWFKEAKNQAVLDRFHALDLRSLKLRRLPELVFKFKNIATLDLRDNLLQDLPIAKMSLLPRLFVVDLRMNPALPLEKQREIADQLPKVLPNLKLCAMDNAEFSTADARNLCNAWPVLRKSIVPVPMQDPFTWLSDPENLARLNGIRELVLSQKKLTDLPDALNHCQNLERLNLRKNRISQARQIELVQTLFTTFPQLQEVILDIGTWQRTPTGPVQQPLKELQPVPPPPAHDGAGVPRAQPRAAWKAQQERSRCVLL